MGVLIDKGLTYVNNIFIPIFSSNDSFLMDYAQKLIYNNDSKILMRKNGRHRIDAIHFFSQLALDRAHPAEQRRQPQPHVREIARGNLQSDRFRHGLHVTWGKVCGIFNIIH